MRSETLLRMIEVFGGQTSIYLDCRTDVRLGWSKGKLGPPAYESELTVFRKHLYGRRPIGVYPLVGDRVKWGCIDLDYDYTIDDAWQVCVAYLEAGVISWVETSRAKGFHVWVFFGRFVTAAIVRKAGQAIVQRLGLPPKTEVNPKQEEGNGRSTPVDQGSGWGNCVRLPYPAWGSRPGRNVMLADDNSPIPLEVFASIPDEELFADFGAVEALAATWQPPAPPMSDRLAGVTAALVSGGRTPTGGRPGSLSDPDCRAVYEGRMTISVGSRDNQLWSLANYLRGIGLTEMDAEAAMTRAWERMENPPNDHLSLPTALSKVRRVYRR